MRRVSGLAVLRGRDFRLWVLGDAASLTGTMMAPVAVTFALLRHGHGAGDVGLVMMAQSLPLVGFLLLGGVISDRFPRRTVMLSADLVRCAAQALLAGLLLSGSPSLWTYAVIGAVVGAGDAFFNPAVTGLIPQLVDEQRLQEANAIRAVSWSAGSALGPALAGIVLSVAAAGWAIAADALTYAISAACLWRVRPRPLTSPALPGRVLDDLRAGWREFRSRTWLWSIVAEFAGFHVVVWPGLMVLGAVVAKQDLGGAGSWGAILAAFGTGSVLASLVLLRVRPRRPLLAGACGMFPFGLPLLALAVPLSTAAVAAAAFAAGVGIGVFGTMWDTTMQREIPPHLLSRVSAYDWFGSVASMPLGFAVIGPLATVLGLRGTLVLGACWLLATNALIAALPAVRGITAPADASAQGGLAVPAHPAGPGTLDHVAQVVPGPPAQV